MFLKYALEFQAISDQTRIYMYNKFQSACGAFDGNIIVFFVFVFYCLTWLQYMCAYPFRCIFFCLYSILMYLSLMLCDIVCTKKIWCMLIHPPDMCVRNSSSIRKVFKQHAWKLCHTSRPLLKYSHCIQGFIPHFLSNSLVNQRSIKGHILLLCSATSLHDCIPRGCRHSGCVFEPWRYPGRTKAVATSSKSSKSQFATFTIAADVDTDQTTVIDRERAWWCGQPARASPMQGQHSRLQLPRELAMALTPCLVAVLL